MENEEVQTWVDLLNHDQGSGAVNGGESDVGRSLKVSMSTPVRSRTASRVERGREEVRTDLMRSQIVSLLKQKQQLVKQVTHSRAVRCMLSGCESLSSSVDRCKENKKRGRSWRGSWLVLGEGRSVRGAAVRVPSRMVGRACHYK